MIIFLHTNKYVIKIFSLIPFLVLITKKGLTQANRYFITVFDAASSLKRISITALQLAINTGNCNRYDDVIISAGTYRTGRVYPEITPMLMQVKSIKLIIYKEKIHLKYPGWRAGLMN